MRLASQADVYELLHWIRAVAQVALGVLAVERPSNCVDPPQRRRRWERANTQWLALGMGAASHSLLNHSGLVIPEECNKLNGEVLGVGVGRQLAVVSLFTGAGGLDYGFEAAGFETRVAIECDPDCVETIRRSRSWPIIAKDIHSVPPEAIRRASGLNVGQADVLIGGPPCQPFSKSGYWANGDALRLKDPRATTLRDYMRCVADLLPKVFLLENVPGIGYAQKQEALQLISRSTNRINRQHGARYQLSLAVLNAADYGVPQIRKRLFLIGDRSRREFLFPKPTHSERGSAGTLSYVTAWEAIGHVRPPDDEELALAGQWADLMPSIPEGENYLWHTSRRGGKPLFGWRRRYWSFLLKLAKDRPAWTLQAQPGPATGPFHWQNRRLSVDEMARLQTFPEGIKFAGSNGSQRRQIGNAVPSLLAEVLAREIRSQLLASPLAGSPSLLVPLKRPIPPPEPHRRVPEKYLILVGSHSDHPGQGRGPGVQMHRHEHDRSNLGV